MAALIAPVTGLSQSWEELRASAQTLDFEPIVGYASGEVADGQAVFRFNVEGSGPHTIEVIVTDVRQGIEHADEDTVLYVFDEDGYVIDWNDDGPYGLASMLNGVDLPWPGIYYAIVTTYPRFIETDDADRFAAFTAPGLSSVAFDITIEFGTRDIEFGLYDQYDDFPYGDIVYDWDAIVARADVIELEPLTTSIAGNIDAGIDVIAFDVDGPVELRIEVVIETSDHADSILAIFDADGYLVDEDDDGGISLASMLDPVYLPAAGRYYVVVSAYPNFAETDWDDFLLGYSDYAEAYFDYSLIIERAR
ncbi:MAG: hypothetical protein EA382_02740 [Spirochaetaceae bacterium]|nr:MAG: hypothetical protein EA382_02740 [Spirochaetaceae bacterium]